MDVYSGNGSRHETLRVIGSTVAAPVACSGVLFALDFLVNQQKDKIHNEHLDHPDKVAALRNDACKVPLFFLYIVSYSSTNDRCHLA